MSAARSDLRTWSRRQWGTVVVTVTLVQVGLVLALNERRSTPPPGRGAQPGPRLVHWQPASLEGETVLAAMDPTVFALPGPRSFSGTTWGQSWTPPSLAQGWTDEVRWLKGDPAWFGEFGEFSVPVMADEAEVRPQPGPSPVTVRPLPLAERSPMELDVDLRRRGLAAPVELPGIIHSNLVAATDVQVSVEPDGHVFSAVVLRSSGLESADEQAVQVALSCRFPPIKDETGPTAERQWGRLRFRWSTVASNPAPSETDGPG